MKRDGKHRYFLAAVGVIAIAAQPWMGEGPQARAQEPDEWCDTYVNWVAKVGNQRAVAGGECPTYGTCDTPSVRDSWIPGPSTPSVTIRIKFHIFCNDDGTNCASSPSGVAAQMTQLNSDYAPYRIQFTESTAAEYINNSTYRDISSQSEVDAMKNTYADDPAHQLNVYVVNVGFAQGTFPWDPDALGNLGGIFIHDDYFGAGQEVLTHECGHNLGLWHTHHGVTEVNSNCLAACYERADGVDGNITGDFASDTPPTPANLTCDPPGGIDSCSGEPWGLTQPENYMSYGEIEDEGCWTLFTAQQAGRKHCWIDDVLTGWIACTTNEVPGSTCQDGVDNDCDGYVDCDDVNDCASDSACFCDDNGGNSPLVCVYWDDPVPPEPLTDFVLDSVTDPNNPDVTFVTGNDGWKVWSQVSLTDDTPANLGHIGINPALPTENFSLTIAHGASAGAANVASIGLVDEGWTGQSNLSGGSIAGDLMGELVLQESGGQGGVASFTIGGDLYGNITIPRVDALHVNGAVFSDALITLVEMVGDKSVAFNTNTGDFAGDLSFPGGIPSGALVNIYGLLTETASVDLNGQELAGILSLDGGSAAQSVINVGPLTGKISLFTGAYSGSVTVARVEPTGTIWMVSADVSGSTYVLGDWKGTLTFVYGDFAPEAVISIAGNLAVNSYLYFDFVTVPGVMAGDLLIGQNCDGFIDILGDVVGDIIAGGVISGSVTVSGEFTGNICGANLSPGQQLPLHIDIANFGPTGTVCGVTPGCGVALPTDPDPNILKNRFISFVPGSPATPEETAIRVELVRMYIDTDEDPTNGCPVRGTGCGPGEKCRLDGITECIDDSNCPPPLSTFDGKVRWLGAPAEFNDNSLSMPNFIAASLECSPYYRDWSPAALAADFNGDEPGPTGNGIDGDPDLDGVLHVFGAEIVPCSVYEVQVILFDQACAEGNEASFSAPLSISTALWGDVWVPFGNVNFTDIGKVVEAFKSVAYIPGSPEEGAPPKVRAMLRHNVPPVNGSISFTDISKVVDGFKTIPYKEDGPLSCSSAVACDPPGRQGCGLCANDGADCESDADCGGEPCSCEPQDSLCTDPDASCGRDAVGNDPIVCRDKCKRCN